MTQSGVGRIRLFEDFCGPELQIANAVAVSTTTGGCNLGIGPFKLTGALDSTYAGVTGIDGIPSGAVRLSTGIVNNNGCSVGTATCFNVALMGTLILEARVQMEALTARDVFIGFTSVNADAQAKHCIGSGATEIALTSEDMAGFLYSDTLTTDELWHFIYNGGSVTGATDSTTVKSSVTPVLSEWDVLRVEVDNNGTARWYINGGLEKTLAGAMAVGSEYLAGVVSVNANETTSATVDLDYLLVAANRDWTI